MIRWPKTILIISHYTFLEFWRNKVLVNTAFLGGSIFLVSYVASQFSFSAPSKVALDFGLGILGLSILGISIFIGSTLISKEIESRNLYMILSRPVKRWVFLTGRYLGLLGILGVNTLILSLCALVPFFFLGGSYSFLIPWSILFIFLEGALVFTMVLFFSLVVNTILAILSTVSLYLVGHYIELAKEAFLIKSTPWLISFVNFYSKYFPNFSKLNIKNFVLYEGHIENAYLFSGLLYGILYCVFFLFASCLIFRRKELL